jgi:hypothetical protein
VTRLANQASPSFVFNGSFVWDSQGGGAGVAYAELRVGICSSPAMSNRSRVPGICGTTKSYVWARRDVRLPVDRNHADALSAVPLVLKRGIEIVRVGLEAVEVSLGQSPCGCEAILECGLDLLGRGAKSPSKLEKQRRKRPEPGRGEGS